MKAVMQMRTCCCPGWEQHRAAFDSTAAAVLTAYLGLTVQFVMFLSLPLQPLAWYLWVNYHVFGWLLSTSSGVAGVPIAGLLSVISCLRACSTSWPRHHDPVAPQCCTAYNVTARIMGMAACRHSSVHAWRHTLAGLRQQAVLFCSGRSRHSLAPPGSLVYTSMMK